jgi:hypothetical protein
MSSTEVAVRFGTPLGSPARPAAREFPSVVLAPRLPPESSTIAVDARVWRAGEADLYWVDAQADALGERTLVPVAAAGEPALRLELLTRCQRWLGRRNRHSETAWFDALLCFHRSLYDREKPLVRADHNRALDAWQWALRLEPDASAAVQVACLFAESERLTVGQAPPMEEFVRDCQTLGTVMIDRDERAARVMTDLLSGSAAPAEVVARSADLCRGRPIHDLGADHGDVERALVSDARCLAFLSVHSARFLDYYGWAHAVLRIAWIVRQLSLRACALLPSIRLRDDVEKLLGAAAAAAA